MKAKGKSKGKTKIGRPVAEISEQQWKKIGEMLAVGCTAEECADRIGITRQTLYNEPHRSRFQPLMKAKHAEMKFRVRKRQLDQAMKGHPVASIWWGKQHLGQRDKHEHTGADGGPMEVVHGAQERLERELDKLAQVRQQQRDEAGSAS